MKTGKRKEPLNNSEFVYAQGASGKEYETTLGELKNAFMNKKLPEEIRCVFVPRQKQYYFIDYKPTKGFNYEKLKGPR